MRRSNGEVCLYIVEGPIEKRFIEQLRQQNLLVLGRVQVFNLMQKKLKDRDSLLNKRVDRIFCIIDTDCREEENLRTLLHNVKKLKNIGKDIVVLAQKENFEGELGYVLHHEGIHSLCTFFHLRHESVTDLKTYLSQSVRYDCYVTKDNVKRYCVRPEEFKNVLQRMGLLLNCIRKGSDCITTY